MVNIINNIKQSINNIVATIVSIFVGMSLINSISNKKGMLGNLIGGFIVILVGVSLMGPIAQEISNATNCMAGNLSIEDNISTGVPQGATDSFGGGGANHFGGYDGKVKHNGFVDAIASTSVVKTNKSILNPDCVPMEAGSAGALMLQMLPLFFALAIGAAGIAMAYGGLRSAGMFDSNDML